MFVTRYWDSSEGAGPYDAQRYSQGIGAEIIGANKFRPPRWQDDLDCKGMWGPPRDSPADLRPRRRPRPPVEMAGGTTFHFLDAAPAEELATTLEAGRCSGRTPRGASGRLDNGAGLRHRRGPSTDVPSPGPDRPRSRRTHLGRAWSTETTMTSRPSRHPAASPT